MKLLTLIRHAKSSWDNPLLRDFDRPLNKRGLRDAPEMGRRLAAIDFAPDLLLCSPAVRASRTAEAIIAELRRNLKLKFEPGLYMAGESDMLNLLNQADESLSHIALVGHNPGLTALANLLGASMIGNIPTAGFVRLALSVGAWCELGPGEGRLVEFDYPKKV